MWKCRRCDKPVYFAERKQSLGFDWHPNCLRCEECGKRLNPGQHAEHKGDPYCHHPCYAALFGPQLFGHGTRNECHTSFGKIENRVGQVKRSHLEERLKVYNQYYEGKPGELKSREANGRLILEGVLRIYWGFSHIIHLKEEDDQRLSTNTHQRVTSFPRVGSTMDVDSDEEDLFLWRDDSPNRTPNVSPSLSSASDRSESVYLGCKSSAVVSDGCGLKRVSPLCGKSDRTTHITQNQPQCNHNTLDISLRLTNFCGPNTSHIVPYGVNTTDGTLLRQDGTTGPDSRSICQLESPTNDANSISNKQYHSYDDCNNCHRSPKSTEAEQLGDSHQCKYKRQQSCPTLETGDGNTVRKTPPKVGSTAIRRRPGRRMDKSKLKRRCSINGHFYLRETSSFRPPYGSPCSVWVTSLTTSEEVLNMLLDKYKVEMSVASFALFIIKDSGEQRRIRRDESPLTARVMLGPHEDVAKIFIMDAQRTDEITHQVAQFLNLSLAECRAILCKYDQEEQDNIRVIRNKYDAMKIYIQQRLEEMRSM